MENYQSLENRVSNLTDTYFVVRDTEHPVDDLLRNWSSTLGGVNFEGDYPKETLEETAELNGEYRYHPAHNGFCIVHYEGLGAFCLDADTIEEAIKEADLYSKKNDLAFTSGHGDGHFFAEDVVSFHKVRDGRYIFEIK